jgi:hypothetical protein
MLLRAPLAVGLGVAFCVACFGFTPAQAAALECPLVGVAVFSPVVQDAQDVCAAALPVFMLFRAAGLDKAVPLVVSVLASLPEYLGPAVLGCFTPGDRRIRVLTFESAKARGTWFGRRMDRTFYRSLVAHEIAHALAWCNTSDGLLSVRGREYVAYAVMFETMDPELREAILEQTPGPGFESEREISDIYFYLAPSRFGVDAYRHYLRPENGSRFLREIMRGAALPILDD